MKWLEGKGYEFSATMMPLGRGALLLNVIGKEWVDSFDLTVNTDGSYHLAWADEEQAA